MISLRYIPLIFFYTILALILNFYYKLFFIKLNKKDVLEHGIQKPVTRPKLFYNGSFNKNLTSEFWSFIIFNFIGPIIIESTNLQVFYHSNNRFYGNKVTRGKSGFYFYTNKGDGDNLKDFLKQNLVSQQQLNRAVAKVQDIVNTCSSLNTSFMLIIGPNKHSVYSEYFPFERPPGITRADQLSEAFKQINMTYIYPRDYLIQLKKNNTFPFYYETDTHWNSLGAYYVSLLIKQKIKEFFPKITFPEINYTISAKLVTNSGDITTMSPLIKPESTWCTIVSVDPQSGKEYANVTKVVKGRNFITTGINQSLPRALIYRDSFFTALEPFISPLLSKGEYIWTKFDKNHFLQVKPDLLIFEMVERYSGYFF